MVLLPLHLQCKILELQMNNCKLCCKICNFKRYNLLI
jgi:hypothetical protein